MKLSIVIPAYNEEQRLPPTLRAYLEYFEPRYGNEFELIVVVNGSRDGTERVVREQMPMHPALRVIVEPRAIGKGGAIILGFREAKGDRVGFVDADGATPPEAFDDLVQHLDDAGAIIASRWFKESRVYPPQPLRRRIASRVFNFLVRLLFRVPIRDTQCGAKVLSRQALEAVLPELGITRWAFDVDLVFKLRRAGFRIIERPTVWHDIGGSQLKIGRASLEMFVAIVRLRLLYSPLRWVVTLYDRTLGRVVHLSR
ncbi:MAG: glycosyltransferase family 2 protein [Kiritimatiellae bacterium]|nr:glycosyltransferase family 2 protein [Kiritimatiellia bacterium]MDW8458459.1 glycosyltransferase family 2 protein [Verrucomicrobiota bacterium]